MRRAATLAVVVLAVAGCKPSYEDQIAALTKLVAKGPMGSSSDYWLVKASSAMPNDRVALIFGFLNDYTFCLDLAELYMQRYPADRYVCLPAN